MNLSVHFPCNLRIQSNRFLALHNSTLKMEAEYSCRSRYPHTRLTRCYTLEDYNLKNHCCENLITETGITCIKQCSVQSGELKREVCWRLYDGELDLLRLYLSLCYIWMELWEELNLWPVHAKVEISDSVHLYCQRQNKHKFYLLQLLNTQVNNLRLYMGGLSWFTVLYFYY